MHQTDGHEHPHDRDGCESCWYRGGPFAAELTHHLPFSILSVTLGLIVAGLICFFTRPEMLETAAKAMASSHVQHAQDEAHDHEHDLAAEAPTESGYFLLFHLFHPAHMLFSAAATAAMFWRYERKWIKAVLVGFSGAVVVCGVSDIAMPYLGTAMLHQDMPLHICVIDHPMLVLPYGFIGVFIGILAGSGNPNSTIFSHTLHVLASTMASIFYLIAPFEPLAWINNIGVIFLFICLAVMVPCCLSDIVYPLLFARDARAQFVATGHDHAH